MKKIFSLFLMLFFLISGVSTLGNITFGADTEQNISSISRSKKALAPVHIKSTSKIKAKVTMEKYKASSLL